jgi:hypothetical protein
MERWLSTSKVRMDSISSPRSVDAVRHGAAGGVQVDQPAAHAELARPHHLLHVGIAGEHELLAQRVAVEDGAGLQVEGAPGEVGARRQALQRRGDRHDAGVEGAARELPQRRQPLGHQVRVGRELVVRQRFPVGQAMHPEARVEPRHLLAQALGVLRRGREDEERAPAPRRAREPQRVGRAAGVAANRARRAWLRAPSGDGDRDLADPRAPLGRAALVHRVAALAVHRHGHRHVLTSNS